ncbi:MAG TPA: cytosolic protein [Bacillus bacterium]|nr:cytosolic protein [Bacillus sp. (in: firmicutes)]
MTERFYLYDDTEETKTRYVSFMGENQRFDLAIMQTGRYYGKSIVLDIQGSRYAIIGQDDLDEEGYLEFAYNLSEEGATELRSFLRQLI